MGPGSATGAFISEQMAVGHVSRNMLSLIIIIIKRISRPSICRTRWEHRALYNNTNHTHTRTHARTHTRTDVRTHAHTLSSDEGIGTAVKNSLEIIIKQVCLEGGFKRGGRIRVAECLRQTVPNGWSSIRKDRRGVEQS